MISGLFETILDRSVVFSFDRSGFLRHKKRFESADVAVDLGGRVALITGANAGIGLETARGLLERGASVHMLCRSLDRAEAARERLQSETGKRPEVWRLDVSNLADIRQFVARFNGDVDILVHNAGVLPNERTLTADGLELTWATNVVGSVLLTECLLERLSRSDDGRVITVSSGGMLLHRLGLSDVGWEKRSQFDEDLGLGLAITGVILLLSRVLDVVSDPLVGWLADRKGGADLRRLVLYGALLGAPSLVLILSPPSSAGALWLLLCSTGLYLGWTLVQIPYLTWGARLSGQYHQRTRVTAAREGAVLVGILLSGSLPAVLGLLGLEEAGSLATLAVIYALLPCVLKLMAVGTVYGLPITPARQRIIAKRLGRMDREFATT